MTLKEWAEKLNGREYREELKREEEAELKAEGYVAVFGASDDLLEFSGAIDDEAGAWNGASVKLCQKQDGEFAVFSEDENDETKEFNRKQISCMRNIKVIRYPKNKKGECWASWLIEPDDIPHLHFDIMEDGDLFCRGTIFSAKEIAK